MQSLSVQLPLNLSDFVRQRVKQGQYESVSEYIRELIRADQKQFAGQLLEAEVLKGLQSGPAQPVTKEMWSALRASVTKSETRKKRA